ncbi:MAG: DinB family protein [Vicinamibacterales bacterium]
MTIGRPQPGDYAPFYQPYLDASASVNDARELLNAQDGLLAAMAGWPEAKAAHRYAEGKWTVSQVVGHMADTERVFAYRLLRIARGDATPLAGFDEQAWQTVAGYDARSLAGVVAELAIVRRASRALIDSLDAAALEREGLANNLRVTAKALAWLIPGHFQHHAGILRDRYGLKV